MGRVGQHPQIDCLGEAGLTDQRRLGDVQPLARKAGYQAAQVRKIALGGKGVPRFGVIRTTSSRWAVTADTIRISEA